MTNVNTQNKLQWETEAFKKYTIMIAKMPLFHREIAKTVVDKKAEINARERNSEFVMDADIIRAFYSEVPFTFYSLMIRLLDDVGFDHKKFEPIE